MAVSKGEKLLFSQTIPVKWKLLVSHSSPTTGDYYNGWNLSRKKWDLGSGPSRS
jgi:hypothetical protein